MRFCRNSVKNKYSWLCLDDFSSHTTTKNHETPPKNTPTTSTSSNLTPKANNFAGKDRSSGKGSIGFADDIGLMSCTESLGFESSDEISSLEDNNTMSGIDSNNNNNNNNCWDNIRSLGNEVTSSSSSSSSFDMMGDYYSNSCYTNPNPNPRMDRLARRRSRGEKKSFPPPLTSLNENGRRDFFLKPVRKDGRLEIVGVKIERPDILCASRQNGRLTLHLLTTRSPLENDEDEDEEDYEEEKIEKEIKKEEEKEKEKENEKDKNDEVVEEEEIGEEEREWKIPTAVSRRCYQQVWGQQRHSIVTTM